MERFEEVRYPSPKGRVTKEELEADVRLSMVEDYQHKYGVEYKACLAREQELEERLAAIRRTKAEMKYEPPTFEE
jgi:hypothetical protein